MSISSKIRTIFRGDVSLADLPREALRRRKVAAHRKAERLQVDETNNAPARLSKRFASIAPEDLVNHFREGKTSFFAFGNTNESERTAKLQTELYPNDTTRLIASANRIVDDASWELAGLGLLNFGGERAWRSDPLNGKIWGLEYHADVIAFEDDGADIRILWELNRFGHVIDLARAYAISNDEAFAETYFSQIESWMWQNPYGRGANWSCAMEVALRAINLLAAFDIFRHSKACTPKRLAKILQFFDQHGGFIDGNDEFSYIATSNHYLSDVVGLFWIGTLLPELEHAKKWRDRGLSEMLREMDKQILPDGADFEASTGYHKFVTEMLLYSCLLAKRNGIEIPERYWDKLRLMIEYIRGIRRPDGRVPLIGDADGSQIVPVVKSDADEQDHLLALGSVVFNEPKFKTTLSPEILWILGEEGIDAFETMAARSTVPGSVAFADAGAYVMRDGDMYLHFNANDCGVNGRGSHAHNDALSVEVSALGRPFIVDPGSYAYNLDREARHLFRSTAYHSTVMIDSVEQNTIDASIPFIIGNEAKPEVLLWETTAERDRVSAEHYGYRRLPDPIVHRRTVEFNKVDKYWIINDRFNGKGKHEFAFSFHLLPGLSVDEIDDTTVRICDDVGRKLYIRTKDIKAKPQVVPAFASRNYGHRESSAILKWTVTATAPFDASFILIPVGPHENVEARLELAARLADNIDN